MTPFPHSIGPDDPVAQALALMEAHRFKHLPVVEHFHCVGVVSYDSVRAAPSGANLRIQDLLQSKPLLLDVATPLDEALRRMIDNDAACAVVLKADKIVGIFTGIDACRVLLERLPHPPPDEAA
jgi:acetoin utilization protein AcuB